MQSVQIKLPTDVVFWELIKEKVADTDTDL